MKSLITEAFARVKKLYADEVPVRESLAEMDQFDEWNALYDQDEDDDLTRYISERRAPRTAGRARAVGIGRTSPTVCRCPQLNGTPQFDLV